MLNSVRFDWFSFTVKGKTVMDVMEDLGLKKDEFTLTTGRFGYDSQLLHDVYNISILFNGTSEMGIHVSVSGTSIRYFMECFLAGNGCITPFGSYAVNDRCYFTAFARYVLSVGKFSRVDVNIDTDMPFLNPYHIHDLAKKSCMITYFRSWHMVENNDGSGTFYLGKRSSNSFIRIYDKAKEQGDFESVLYRLEVQFNKAANDFMRNFLEFGLSSSFLAYLHNQLRFTEYGEYHGTIFPEWQLFLDLIHKNANVDYRSYDSKRRKNSIDSILHMFTQYNNCIMDFFDVHGTVDDFIEFLFAVDSHISKKDFDICAYLSAKGWQ